MPLYLEEFGYITGKTAILSTGATLNKYTFTAPVTGGATITLADTSTLTTAGNFTTAGAFDLTFTSTADTSVTLPASGTLATLAGSETFANKTLTSPIIENAIMDGKSIFKTDGTTSQIKFESAKITLGSDTQSVETVGNLIVGGNFTVNGVTHTIESDVTHIVDPVFELGSKTITDVDTLDRGLKIYYGDGLAVQNSFIGWNRDSNDEFTFIKKITAEANVNGSFTGEYGDAKFKDLILTSGNITNSTLTDAANVFATTTGTTTLGGGAVNISVTGSTTTVKGGLQVDQTLGVIGETTISNTTTSTNKDTGALKVFGGVGIVENANIGGNLGVVGTTQLNDDVTILASKSLTYKGSAITATGAELNVLSGITATGAELNVLDGDTVATDTTIDGNHQVVYNNGGTMQQVSMLKIQEFCRDSSLSQSAHRIEIIPCNSSIFGTKLAPIVMGATQISQNYDGWYFKNIQVNGGATVGTASWTMYPLDSTWKISDLQYLQIGFMPLVTEKKPKISITTSAGSISYETSSSSTQYSKHEFLAQITGIGSPLQIPGHSVCLASTLDSVTTTATISKIEIFMEGTVANDTEMIIHECNWVTTSQGTISYKFTNDSVVQAQSAQAVAALYAVLYNQNVSQTDTNILFENELTGAGYNGTISSNVYGEQNVLANYVHQSPLIQYSSDLYALTVDVDIGSSIPAPQNLDGFSPSASTWTISSPVPDGLSFNSDGSITGTPISIQPATVYTVTVENSAGLVTSDSFIIKVVAP